MKNVSFELYRYQLLPITRQAQQHLFQEIVSVEDIEKNKNMYVGMVLANFPKMTHRTYDVNQENVFYSDDVLCLKVAVQKTIERNNVNFKREKIEDWPYATILINNKPDVQMIAVSKNDKAFSSSGTVIKTIQSLINKRLKDYHLQMHTEAMFDKKEFWSIVTSHQTRLTSMKFELISPNMANISGQLKINLKELNKETNSHRTNIEFNSPIGAALEVSQGNPVIGSLLDYASEGGGDISFKIKGLKKKIHTSTSIKTVEVDEVMVENMNPAQLEHFTGIFKL